MGVPLDAVSVGHWLICSRGPTVKKSTVFGPMESRDRECEGLLARVLAVSAPFVFLQIYPIPSGNMTTVLPPSGTTVVEWSTVEFIRPSRGYLRVYLKLLRQRTEQSAQTRALKPKKKTSTVIDPWFPPKS
jgi:hypothetical protein